MLVKDLIYLLQTRGKPDDEVLLSASIKTKSGSYVETICHLDDSFYSIYTDDDEFASTDSVCKIHIGRDYLPAFLKQIKEAEEHECEKKHEKIRHSKVDLSENKKYEPTTNIEDDKNPGEDPDKDEI